LPWLNTFDPYMAAAVHHAGRDDLGIRTSTGKLADRPISLRPPVAVADNAPEVVGQFDCTDLSSTGEPPEKLK
jgi:hypothetical protein